MMTKAVDAAGNETLFFYDASGQRFLKVFRAADKTKSEMRTWYLSDGYELREQYAQRGSRDKVGEQATLFFRAGERFASQTGKVSLANASINYLVAGMFSGGFLGIAQKIYYLGKGSFYDLRFRFLFYGLLVSLLVIYLSFHFYKNNDRLEKRENMVSLYYRQIAIVLSGILLSLNVSSCMGEGSFYIHKKNFNSIYGGLPVGTYYYTHDHLGSGSLITDENGNEHFRVVLGQARGEPGIASVRFANPINMIFFLIALPTLCDKRGQCLRECQPFASHMRHACRFAKNMIWHRKCRMRASTGCAKGSAQRVGCIIITPDITSIKWLTVVPFYTWVCSARTAL